mmetsp:Transcript_19618/g.49838  ORF Transcript_19618/g.49838 Transcript_19618/m.49838 type:complete len:232 (+) Transcript_19618:240-935(+)
MDEDDDMSAILDSAFAELEMGGDATAPTAAPTSSGTQTTASSDPIASAADATESFKPPEEELAALLQDDKLLSTINEALESLTKNAESLKDMKPEEGAPDAMFESLLKSFEGSDSVDGMIGMLLSKDILYEPIQELAQKMPAWVQEHDATLSAEERTRYTKQVVILRDLCGIYEREGDSLGPAQLERVMKALQDMQELGQPPKELLESLAPGMQLGEDGVPAGMPEGCCVM